MQAVLGTPEKVQAPRMTVSENPKRPRGRPRGPSPDSRTVTPCVRWRPEEWAAVEAAAERNGMSTSEWLRAVALASTGLRIRTSRCNGLRPGLESPGRRALRLRGGRVSPASAPSTRSDRVMKLLDEKEAPGLAPGPREEP